MTRPGSIRHFLRYAIRDTANRVYLCFIAFFVLIFMPARYLIDEGQRKADPSYISSWSTDSFWAILMLASIGIALLGSTIVKYRKHLKVKV